MRLSSLFLAVVLFQSFFIFATSSNNDTGTSVIGGSSAFDGQFPWAVRVYFTTSLGLTAECMGSLYQLDWVLTAGHCVKDGAFNYRVKAGTVQFSGTGETRTVSQTIRHPSYSETSDQNDIALLKLSSPYTASSSIKTIPVSLVAPSDGEVFVTAGFGYTDNNGDRPATLQWVQLPYIDSTTCERTLLVGTLDPATMICAGGSKSPAADTCNGDSGSGLVRTSNPSNPAADGQLVGLTSFGTSICASGSPAVYTRLAAFYDSFIVPNAGANTASTPTPTVPKTATKILRAKACKKNKNKNKQCRLNAATVGVCQNKRCRKQ